MANDYTTTQLQLTRNYLDGDIKSESIAAPDMADQDFVVEDNGDQVTQPAGGEVVVSVMTLANPYKTQYPLRVSPKLKATSPIRKLRL